MSCSVANPSLGGGASALWALRLRGLGSAGHLVGSAAAMRVEDPPPRGEFTDRSTGEACWVAVAETADGAWSAPSEVVCIDGVAVEGGDAPGACSAAGSRAPGSVALLAGLAFSIRRRRG